MRRRLLSACAVVWLAMLPAVTSGQAVSSPTMAELQGRLSFEQMTILASQPIGIVRRQGLAAGKAAFERLLARARSRHGARSLEVADLIQSFGVGLYGLRMDSEYRFRRESIPYLEAAIRAYGAVFGSAHPEVAIANNTLADAQLGMNRTDPPQSVEAAYEKAYRIRLAAFGPAHVLTLSTLRSLANVRGLPSRTRGERARIEASAALFRQLVAHSPNDQRYARESRPYARAAFAQMFALNRMAAEAIEQLRLAAEQAAGWPLEDRCRFIAAEMAKVERILDGAQAVVRDGALIGLGGQSECSQPGDEPAMGPLTPG